MEVLIEQRRRFTVSFAVHASLAHVLAAPPTPLCDVLLERHNGQFRAPLPCPTVPPSASVAATAPRVSIRLTSGMRALMTPLALEPGGLFSACVASVMASLGKEREKVAAAVGLWALDQTERSIPVAAKMTDCTEKLIDALKPDGDDGVRARLPITRLLQGQAAAQSVAAMPPSWTPTF